MACEIKISFKFQGYGAHCSEGPPLDVHCVQPLSTRNVMHTCCLQENPLPLKFTTCLQLRKKKKRGFVLFGMLIVAGNV